MAYKEFKLEPGEAASLYEIWNSGMTEPETKGKAKTAKKKTASSGKAKTDKATSKKAKK